MKSERFRRIVQENIKFEKESPYNFCDRWCERCSQEKQNCCRLYQDEFEQKITCIAHGREPNNPEITAEVLKWQFEGIDEKIQQFCEENDIEIDDINELELEEIKENRQAVKNHPLNVLGKQYLKMAHQFLKKTFYDKKGIEPKLIPHFERVAWYHTLLSVKLYRALSGFHEQVGPVENLFSHGVDEYEFSLCDAVAQFAICKKSINESVNALQAISSFYPDYKNPIIILLTLLRNILKGIEELEESI